MVEYIEDVDTIISRNLKNKEMNVQANSGQEVIDKEDVLVIGSYTGDDGVFHNPGPGHLYAAGIGNDLSGTLAGHLGNKNFKRTSRGNNLATTRTRRRIVNKQF